MSGPARGRSRRAITLRALWPCLGSILALTAFDATFARAQTLTPDLLRPVRDGFVSPQDSPLRRTADGDSVDEWRPRAKDTLAPSRIGNIPTYGLAAASGASASGYDSLNRTRKKSKYYPGQARPKPPPGPGSRVPVISTGPAWRSIPPSETAKKPPIPPAMAGSVAGQPPDRKSTRLNSSHGYISYAVFCLKKKKKSKFYFFFNKKNKNKNNN